MIEQMSEDIFFERGYSKGYSDAQENLSKKYNSIIKDFKFNYFWHSTEEESPPNNSLLVFYSKKDGYFICGLNPSKDNSAEYWMEIQPIKK